MTIDDRLRSAGAQLREQTSAVHPKSSTSKVPAKSVAIWAVTAVVVTGGLWAVRSNTSHPADLDSGTAAIGSLPQPESSEIAQPTTETSETTNSIPPADTTPTLDQNGPVAVTGIRIGESGPSNPPLPGRRSDGSIDIAQVPEWIAVGDPANPEGGCVGYVRKSDLWPQNATPENADDPIAIYDEDEQVIGQIADGKTTIFDSSTG